MKGVNTEEINWNNVEYRKKVCLLKGMEMEKTLNSKKK